MIRTKLFLSLSLALAFALSCGGPSTPTVQPTGGGDGVAVGGDTGGGDTGALPASRDEILAASDLPAPMPAPLDGDGLGVTIHRLSNGLTVYISTDRQKPRFDAWIAVRAGSRHDPADSTGLAHYLEHMLFKGTDELGTVDIAKEQPHLDRIAALYDELRKTDDAGRRGEIFGEIDAETQQSAKYAIPNELDQLYASIGVSGLNAFTWHEMTVYISDVPSNRFEAWARLEAERFRDPRFRLFYPELEAVYEEKNRSLDNTGRRIDYEMHLALYPEHPYGTQPTIGTVEHLKSPAYGDMVEFFQTWYVPNNVAIILAGDIDPATAVPALERYFAGWEPKSLPKPAEAALPPVEGRREITVEAEGENALTLAWRTAGINHPDQPALEVMDFLMSNAAAGLIDVELVLSQKLPRASSTGAHYLEAGHWELRGTAREGQSHEEVEKLLLGVVAKLQAGEFAQQDIDAIVLQAEMNEMRELESNGARVGKMADAWLMHQSWDYAAKRSERLRSVRVEDVVRVAKQYLGDDYVAIKRVKGKHSPPKMDKPKITPIEIDPSKESAFAHSIKEMPAEELSPVWLQEGVHYVRDDLPAGELLVAKNDTNELFSLSYKFELGNRQQKLLCFAIDLLERSGTADLSAEELQRTMWRMGTKISMRCGPDEVTLQVTGVDRNLEQSVRLLDQWLRTARLEDAALAKLVDNTLSQRKDQMAEPRYVGQALSAYATRGKDSQFLLAPSNKMLQRAKTGQLAKLIARLPDHQHRTSYFGPRDSDAVAQVVALGKKHKKVRPRKPIEYRRAKGTQIFFTHKDVAQSQIIAMMSKPPLPMDDRPVAELYSEYLGGGMGGLVFQEIREARGLAYSAWAGHRAGNRPKDQSAMIGFVGTQTDKTIDALGTLLALVRALPMHPERFTKAKESLDQSYRASRVDPRSVTGWVMGWDDLGLDGDPRPEYWETIKELDEPALKAFADRFADGGAIISIMGDRARIDMKALSKIGKVTEVDVSKLFSY